MLAFKSLPTLNYHLSWSSFDNVKTIKKYEQKVYDFLEKINVKEMVRDGLYESGEVGTIVACLRNGYVQFLDLDDLRINKQVNGKWIVEYDLSTIKQTGMTVDEILQVIESLPPEVSVSRYNEYRSKPSDKTRFVPLSNCDVIKINGNRNNPFGLPLSMGAWAALIQKEIINRVERSVSDRLIKQVLILYAGNIGGKENGKPAPKQLIEHYFQQVSNLVLKKEQNTMNTNNSSDVSGTGVISLPDFFELKTLDVDTTMFTKDLYQKINNDIFMNMGISPSLIYGGGDSNYSSAQVNSEKLFRYIFTVLESFESVINGYISKMLPNGLSCKFWFDRTTMLDKDKSITQAKEFYMQTGVWGPWAESVFGVPYHYILGMARYEKEVINIPEYISPPLNAYTTSGADNKSGRPETDTGNPNSVRGKTSGANDVPSPSD